MEFDVADRVSKPDGQASSLGTTRKDSTIPDRKITRPMASVAVYLADFCFGGGGARGVYQVASSVTYFHYGSGHRSKEDARINF